jgi:membrane peptidoglycan carboxypeptidase
LRGTGKGHANLKGYTSGGKTGSAQIFDIKTHVYTHTYNASFLGFAPVANPQIVIAVTLNHTTTGTAGYGGPAAAPVFREVAMDALRMLDVPKDLPGGVSGAPEGERLTARPSTGQQAVSSVTPPPVQAGASASAETSSLDRRHFLDEDRRHFLDGDQEPLLTASAKTPGVQTTPDFSGKSLRSVLEESAADGFPVEVHGSGLARSQDPPPGTPLRPHALVRVQFGR